MKYFTGIGNVSLHAGATRLARCWFRSRGRKIEWSFDRIATVDSGRIMEALPRDGSAVEFNDWKEPE